MSIIRSSLLLGAGDAAAGGLQVSRSLRYSASDSSYLSRTPSVAGNRKTWTWSGWVKRSGSGSRMDVLSTNIATSGNYLSFQFSSSNAISLGYYNGEIFTTSAVYRDFSAWMHVVLALDTTLATAADRVKLYVNGSRVTTFSTDNISSVLTQNSDQGINAVQSHSIGRNDNGANVYFDGYLANIHFIDGQALTPASFAETDATTGQWIPKAYSGGSYGTNGFYLQFADNSSNTASTLGKDSSGNGNNWTPNNFAINTSILNYSSYWVAGGNSNAPIGPNNAFDGSTSTYFRTNGSSNTQTWTPASSIAYTSLRVYVYNLVGSSTNTFFVNGVAQTTPSSTGWVTPTGVSSPLTSIEIRETASTALGIAAVEINGGILLDRSWPGNDSLVDSPTNYGTDTGVGGEVRGNYCTLNPLQTASGATLTNGNLDVSTTSTSWQPSVSSIFQASGKWYAEFTVTSSTANAFHIGIVGPGFSAAAGNYIGVTATSYAYRADNGNKFNNTSSAAYGASYTTGDVIGIAMDLDAGTLVFYKNGASQGTAYTGMTGEKAFAISVGGTSGTHAGSWNFGQRAFAYTAPSGFKALNTQNLPAPLVTKSNTVMDAVLYTGNGGTQTISGLGFSPDLVWLKRRDSAGNHALFDAVRGATNFLISSSTSAEGTDTNSLTAFTSTGFTVNDPVTTSPTINGSGQSYVAWAWDAGTSTVSNTQGSITSQVRANATAGFSVVTYTGNSTNGATVGHGLGVTPSMIILKSRSLSPSDWPVTHVSLADQNNNYLILDATSPINTLTGVWSKSSTTFGFPTSYGGTNLSGQTYVAYCFAPVVGYSSMSSYTGNGSADGPFVYTGFRPKFIMVKRSDASGEPWVIHDSTRDSYNGYSVELYPNSSAAEGGPYSPPIFDFLSNGFKIRSGGATAVNASGGTFIYLAVAESPFNYSRAR